jgi:hypothetical protein
MVHTTRLEEEEKLGTSYFDCFRGTNLRRTEIACGAFLSQITDGGAFAYSPMYCTFLTLLFGTFSKALRCTALRLLRCQLLQ